MSNRTIKAPGVEIFEHDLSEYPAISEGTHVLIAGFAQKGEDYTPYRLTSRSSWLKFYGAPTNEAEEYFYNAANTVLDQGGYLYSVKIPYSNDIRGIYAAAKFRIEDNRELYKRDEDGVFVDAEGEKLLDLDNEHAPDEVRFQNQYGALKDLGIAKLSKIAPQGQDFLSYDTVEEYESGESKPSSNTIYIVDKTRAIYTRATKVHDQQANRDARSCLGIVPVLTTMVNTAWFQRKSTGLTAPIPELYQPVRSLKTIMFPAGAGFAAEYLPTNFVDEDFSIKILNDNSYDRSLAEMAAMQAQSCLINGNMVDGKFAPGVCNDVALIIFKAFVSTEDGKIDFDIQEQFVGSLDPDARNEKGVSTYLPTLVNNNSDYVYMFANLDKPKLVCTVDHAFVAGSNSSFEVVKDDLQDESEWGKGSKTAQIIEKNGKVVREIKYSEEFHAATAFSAYAARMLGFDSTFDQDNQADATRWDKAEYSLQSFYNQDPMEEEQGKCAITDELIRGDAVNVWRYADPGNKYNIMNDIMDDATDGSRDDTPTLRSTLCENEMKEYFSNKSIRISSKFIADRPTCEYFINKKENQKGQMVFSIVSPTSVYSKPDSSFVREGDDGERALYVPDAYDYKFRVGRMSETVSKKIDELLAAHKPIMYRDVAMPQGAEAPGSHADVDDLIDYEIPEGLQGYKFFELSIFNSTDYLKAILQFEDLIDLNVASQVIYPYWTEGLSPLTPEEKANMDEPAKREYENKLTMVQDMCVRYLLWVSTKKTAKFRYYLRQIKKAQAALDRLDDSMATLVNTTSDISYGTYSARMYVRDLYNSLSHMGVLSGIDIITEKEDGSSSEVASLAAKGAALEKKLDDLINPDTSKKEKAEPTKKVKGSVAPKGPEKLAKLGDYPEWYVKCRIYLRHKLFECYRDMYTFICDTLDHCAYTQDLYIQTQQSIDDSNLMLGFYPEMAEPIITYTEIAQTLNKLYDTFGDVNTTTIDVVCDAGLSNIAQFVKQVYDPSTDDGEDIGGRYEPVRESYNYNFNKWTDISFWKTIVFKLDTFCKSVRKDCMFVTECPRRLVLDGNKPVVRKTKKDTSVDVNIIPYLTKITGFNTSYGAGYMNWYKTVSDYTGDVLWIPPSIVAAGTYILTDRDYNWWDAPAGMKRGKVSMSDVSFNPNMRQAGEIYDVAWNYAINYQGEYINGIIQEGQKTFQSYHSAFDRVNVRRLFLRCERYVYFASRAFLYEPNTKYTRRRYVDAITPFFEDIKNRGGMYDYIIICDESNNTPDSIDRNELRVKIGIQPVKTIEFILVDFVATRTGSDWSELATI